MLLQSPSRHTGGAKTRRWLCPDLVRNDAGQGGKVQGNGTAGRYYAVPGVSFPADQLDAAVWEYCLQVTDRGVDRPEGSPEPTDEVAQLEARLAQLGEAVATGLMDVATAGRASMLVREQLTALRAAAPVLTSGRVLDLLEAPGALRRAFEADALTFTDRRTVVLALVDHVVVRGRYSKLPRLVIEPRATVR